MADYSRGGDRRGQQDQHPISYQILKAAAAASIGGSMLLLSGLTLTGTVIVLTVATPLLVIFSPVLVPATIAVVLIVGGFLISGVFGVAALLLLSWMYRYVTGKRPVGADEIDKAQATIASKAREYKESAQHRIEQVTS
ncbi:oleosin 16 kDa-like [Dendrobium catenatum]|uniref:Oleosin 16 kDa n=1 Tax=Dendrobium catenatum TaxID=906689 RepID=A0A2I0X206_9ASPA|nr:oleosin 16 kDa-like [Dendrobium catenatum]PKU81927.1 Oleosin 16 kDa [Dendrobium catenatum]